VTKHATRGEAGFTLIEVLVAFAILGISLGVLFELYSTTLRNSARSDTQKLAVLLARSTLDRIGPEIPLVAGGKQGDLGEGFKWRASISDYGDAKDQPAMPVRAFQVAVSVVWMENGAEKSISLTTLRLAPKG
jgi:general secretion pathway protein I